MTRALAVCALTCLALVLWWAWRREPESPAPSVAPAPAAWSAASRPGAPRPEADPLPPASGTLAEPRAALAPRPIERPATRLVGRLVAPDGRGIAGVLALAWWSGREPALAEVERALAHEHPELVATESGPDGRVEFAGLDPRRDYTVTAGGAGWIAREQRSGWHVGGDGYELPIEPWYGLQLALRRADGTRFELAREVRGWRFVHSVEDGQSQAEPGRPIELTLAGLDARALSRSPVLLYRSSREARALGPLSIELAPPGIEPLARRGLELPRLAAPLAELELRVEARSELEPVRVRFVDARGRPTRTTPAGRVRFQATEVDDAFELESGPGHANPLSSRSIPRGEYRVRFEGTLPSLVAPPSDVEPALLRVGADGGELLLALPPTGRIELELSFESGVPFAGSLEIELATEDGGLASFAFDQAPYAIEFVPAGIWTLRLVRAQEWFRAPPPERSLGATRARVEVASGSTARALLRPWND